jgi:YD repeat-containing protein
MFRLAVCAVIMTGALLAGTPASAGTTIYKYDTQGRIIEVDYPNGWIVTYTYDAAGNRTRTARHT